MIEYKSCRRDRALILPPSISHKAEFIGAVCFLPCFDYIGFIQSFMDFLGLFKIYFRLSSGDFAAEIS